MRVRFAGWLYARLEAMQRKPDKILYNSAVREDLQTLEPAGDTQARQRAYVTPEPSCVPFLSLVQIFHQLLQVHQVFTPGSYVYYFLLQTKLTQIIVAKPCLP